MGRVSESGFRIQVVGFGRAGHCFAVPGVNAVAIFLHHFPSTSTTTIAAIPTIVTALHYSDLAADKPLTC
jgi:hypothetical protein